MAPGGVPSQAKDNGPQALAAAMAGFLRSLFAPKCDWCSKPLGADSFAVGKQRFCSENEARKAAHRAKAGGSCDSCH